VTSTITITGNVTRDVELKFLGSGNPAAKFSVAVNRRWMSKKTQEWEESTSYFDVQAYGALAENVANSVQRGTKVIVTGRIEQRSWDTEDGAKRSTFEIVADEIGAALSFATAVVAKTQRPQTAQRSAAPAFEDAF